MAKPCKIIASPKLAKILNIQPNQELSYNDWARILHDGGFDTLINEEIVSIKGISPQPKAVKTNPTALSNFKAGLAKFKVAATTAQSAAERVASALKEAGISVKMIDNEEDYNREAQNRGGGKGTEGMFISTDGVIYLNKNKLQGNWGTTIVWHEGTHPIINIIRNTNPDLFNKIVSGAKKLTADKGLQNALKFAEAYRDGMTITENSEGKFELYDGENLVDTFDSEQAAQDYIDAVVADEFIVEAIARIVDGKINIEQLPSSLRQSIVDFINNILNALGVKGRVSDTDIAQFKKLAAQVSDVLQSGRSISEIVGKENVNKFTKNLVNSDGSKFSQFRISNKFKNLINNVQYEYISDTEEFQDLIKDGKITSNKKLKDFDGLYVMLHVPDNAFTGKLIKDGNTLVDGKGGVYFPIRYNKEGYFWASTEAAVDKLVNVLNETRKANPDKIVRLALVSSKSDKIMSSANASNAMVDVLFSKAFDNRAKLTESQVKKSIINGLENAQKEIINSYNEEIEKRKKKISETKDAKEKTNQQKSLDEFISKGYEVVPKINIKDNADNIKNILADFYNPDNSSFQVKKSINQNILSNLADLINDKDASDYKAKLKKEYEKQLAEAKNEDNQKNIDRISKKINNLASLTKVEERPVAEEILKFLGLGKDAIRLKSTGGRLSSSNLMQGFSDLLGEPLLKGGESNNIYAVLELNTDVEKVEIPKEIEHGSYPFAVKGKDGAKVVLHILQDRNNWQENVLDPATNERIVDNERALEIMPTTAGVTFTPIKISTASSVQASKGQREEVTLPDGRTVETKPLDVEVVNGFYSPIEKNLMDYGKEKIKAKDWLNVVGKGDEAVFTGVRAFLEGKDPNAMVSKQEILDYMKDNRISVSEVVLKEGEGKTAKERFGKNIELEGEKENYKEVLVTLPNKVPSMSIRDWYDNVWRKEENPNAPKFEELTDIEYDSVGEEWRNWQSKAEKSIKFKSTHFDEPNILVHLRMNTRTDSDGNKVLFLEEVQSDWGQTGKKEGFDLTEKEVKDKFDQADAALTSVEKKIDAKYGKDWDIRDNIEDVLSKEDYSEYQKAASERAKWGNLLGKEYKTGNPTAPFVMDTNAWTKLGLKVALKEAVAQGVDKIAWTTGEQQNDRYDLSKQVESIGSTAKRFMGDIAHDVTISLENGEKIKLTVVDGKIKYADGQYGGQSYAESYKGKSLEDAIGKELAEKVLSVKLNEAKFFEGEDLKVGGKGMKAFYGSIEEGTKGIVGGVAEKVFGQKVGETKIKITDSEADYTWTEDTDGIQHVEYKGVEKEFKTEKEAQAYVNEIKSKQTLQPSVDITPELKAEVQRGLPQFSKGQRNQDLIDYVKNSLNNISPEDLSQSLQEDLGYTKEDADAIVDEAIKEKKQGKQEQKEEPKEQPKQEPFKGREKERSFTVKQFLEDPTIPEEIKEAVTEDAIYYNELPNSISVGMANKLYDLLGVDDALNAIMDDMNGMPPAIRIVLGQVIIRRAAAEGGALAEAKIILKAEAELAKRGTEYGQAIQAFSLFQWLSPEGQIMYAVKQRQAEIDAKVKEDKDKIKAKKAAVKKANQEAIEEVLDGKTGDAIDESSKAKPKETSRPKSYGENNKIVTKSRYEQLKKAARGKLYSGLPLELIQIGIYHIEAGSKKFADFSKEMIKDLGSGAAKYLKDLYNAAKNEYLKEGGDASGFSDDNEIQDVENQREAEKLASFIVNRAKTKSPSLDPAKQIVATLLAKVSEKIPSQELAKLSDIEKIALAIKNREQYADVWEKSKEIVEAKIDELEISEEEKDDMKAALKAYFDEMIGQPFSDRMLKSAVRKALKDLGTDIKDVIKRHYTVADSTKRTLVEKLIMEANLSGEDAKYLADRVEREFNAIATAKKKKALESVRTVGEKLPQNAKKTKQLEDKLIELSNLGAFSDEEFVRAYAESMGWKQVTQEDIAQLRKLAEIVEKEQDGFRRARAVEDLLAFHAKMKGVSFADLALSVWYANTLSGRKTQETNILGGVIGLGFGYVATGIKNPRSLLQVTKAIMRGFNRGYLEGMSTLTTGYSPIRGKIDVPNALELTKFKGKYNPANALKYVTRFMKAADVVFFEAGKEMRAYQYAKKLASEQLSGEPNAEQTQKALEILGNTKEKLAEAKAQAMQEFKNRFKAIQNETDNAIKELKNEINRLTATLPQGSKELKDKVEFINKNIANLLKEKEENIKQERKDINRRIFEILEQQRTKTADDFISKTEEYGRRLTFNYQPEGILGKVAQGVNMITGAFTPLKLVVPFTNIIANIANQSLDYTPIGFLRAGTKEGSIGEFLVRKLGFGNTKASIRGNQQFDEEYRSDMLVKASMGILLTGLVYALSQTGDDDEEPILEITADGYGNYKDNYSLKETGWQPYSIKVGNKWYSYQYTPLLPMFAFIGKLNDVQKYRKEKLNDGSWTKARIAAGAASKSFFDNTYLSSLNAVLSTIFSDESDSMIENAMTSLMKTLSGFVLPNFYTQEAKEVESIMNIPTKELGDEFYANAIKDIPFLRDKYYAKVNGLGEDIVPDTDKFVSKVVTPSQQGKVTTDDLWLLLAKNKMPIRVQSFRQFNSDGVYDPKKDEIRVIDRKEYYEYTKKRGTLIKDFMMEHYDQLSKLKDDDFRYIMDGVLTESSNIAKMSLFPDEYRTKYDEKQLMLTNIKIKLYDRNQEKIMKKAK